jgi:hypothetical protein
VCKRSLPSAHWKKNITGRCVVVILAGQHVHHPQFLACLPLSPVLLLLFFLFAAVGNLLQHWAGRVEKKKLVAVIKILCHCQEEEEAHGLVFRRMG